MDREAIATASTTAHPKKADDDLVINPEPTPAPASAPAKQGPPPPPVHPLVRFAVERRVTMSMVLLGVFVLGLLALGRLPLELLPTISSSNISVSAPYPSSSPDEVARRIVQPLEESFGTLNRLDRMTSRASADEGQVTLEFVDGTNMDLAAVEVRDRIDRVRHLLPGDLRQIRIRRFQSSDIPAMRFHLTADWDQDKLYDFTERVLARRLERLDGVAQVDLRGVRKREAQVLLDADRLAAHGVTLREVAELIRANHENVPAGHLREGSRKLQVRILGELSTLEEIRELPLGPPGLRLGDVAEIVYDYPRQDSWNYLNSTEALTIGVYKASNANLLDVADRARAELDGLLADPANAGLSARIFHDSSRDVRKGLADLRNAGIVGGLLAVGAVFLFLRRVRTTLLVAIAIPVSVVITFVFMFLLRQAGWSDQTLNVVSLMGLVLALGMLVDNSIVVIESIYRRIEELGEDPKTAALRGTSEVALAITASTATTLCVFVPLIFLSSGGGFFSLYAREIATTTSFVLTASLLVALTVVPMAAAMVLEREVPPRAAWLDRLNRRYAAVLRLTLARRLIVLPIVALLLAGTYWLVASIERAFAPQNEERQVAIEVDTPRSFSVEQSKALFAEVTSLLAAHREELGITDVAYRFATGSSRGGGFDRQRRIDVFLADEGGPRLPLLEVQNRIRALLPTGRPGVDMRIGQSGRGPNRSVLELEIAGDDPRLLEDLGREVAVELRQAPMVRDVNLSLESGDDEVRLTVQRERALTAGLSSRQVAQAVQSSLSDRALSYLKTEDRDVDLVVRYRDEDRETLTDLRNVRLAGREAAVQLDAVASLAVSPGPQSIDRENRRPKVTLTANMTSPRGLFAAMGSARATMESKSLPPGYSWSFGRWNRMGQRDGAQVLFALFFALPLVYMLMAVLFESFSRPLVILFSVPFAFVGVGLTMRLASIARDSFTDLGFLLLIGVVVNNAIVLVAHVDSLRRQGLGRDEAILLGGQHRLRAILMTALTTVLGLLPMAGPVLFPGWFGPVEGRAATWAPVSLVILGGLSASTFLTLLLTPTVYAAVSDAAQFVRRAFRAA